MNGGAPTSEEISVAFGQLKLLLFLLGQIIIISEYSTLEVETAGYS